MQLRSKSIGPSSLDGGEMEKTMPDAKNKPWT